jgi:LPXTG-motif cell wall-anchored protein
MPGSVPARLIAAAVALAAAVGVSLVGAAPASADVLVGEAAFLAARDDPDAVAPSEPCDATAANPAALRTLAAAAGTATVICLGPNWAYRSPADYSTVDEIRIERDVVVDLQGNTRDNTDTTWLRIAIAPGHHLQLRDTSPTPGMLTLLRGIQVPPTASLVVWSGGIMPWGQLGDAAIGGVSGQSGGDIVVRGGTVDAHSEDAGAGIGGGSGADAGSFTMWGGTVTTTSRSGAALGGGLSGDGGGVTVHGGALTATAAGFTTGACPWMCIAVSAPAIGGGNNGSGGEVLVTGGTVVATSMAGAFGVAIGGSLSNSGTPVLPGTLTVTGGSVTATGAEGIGGGWNAPGGTVTISGGEVHVAAGRPIGGEYLTSGPDVAVTGGTLDAAPFVLDDDSWVMDAVIGSGGATAASGSLHIGAGATVSLTAKGGAIFGDHGLASVEVAGTLSIDDGTVTADAAGASGIPDLTIGDAGLVTGSGTLQGVAAATLVNDGSILAAVDATELTVTHNNYLVRFDLGVPPLIGVRAYAPSIGASHQSIPLLAGAAALETYAGVVVDTGTPLATVVTSGSREDGTAVVTLARLMGHAVLEVPAVVAAGDPVIPVFSRVRADDSPIGGVDDAASFTVTGAEGDVTASVVAGDVLTFATPGTYQVSATSTVPGFTHLTATAALEVATPPTLTTASLPDAVSGEPYTATLAVTGSPASALTVAGDLPPGLTLTGSTISGTPTEAGDFPFSITATNQGGSSSRALGIRVAHGAPVSLSLALPSGTTVQQGGSVTLDVRGTDALGQTFDAGDLVTLTSDAPTDVVSGTTVTFPHASPHVITATLTGNPLVFTTLLIEVRPLATTAAVDPLAATGAPDASGALTTAVLALLGGAVLLVLRRRRSVLGAGQ